MVKVSMPISLQFTYKLDPQFTVYIHESIQAQKYLTESHTLTEPSICQPISVKIYVISLYLSTNT